MLINDTASIPPPCLQALRDLDFTLLSWNEEMKLRNDAIGTEWKVFQFFCLFKKTKDMPKIAAEIEEKEKRIELLFRVVGTKETLKANIKMKLWGKDFKPREQTETKEQIDANKQTKTKELEGEFQHYVLTYDNILKMIAIYLRIQSNTPIILMGETGCGKTSLIKYLAKVANVSLQAIDVHGGFGRHDLRNIVKACVNKWEEDGKRIAMEEEEERKKKMIEEEKKENEERNRKKREEEENMNENDKKKMEKMKKNIEEMKKRQNERDREQWIFLDEINTSPDIGWLNELVCNHTLDGVKIPEGIKVIAACNPYRKRKLSDEEDELLANDALSKYVYRVHPLCETMKEYVWSFGRLSKPDEKQYIEEMVKQVKRELPSTLHIEFEAWKDEISKKIATAQNFLLENLKDKAIVSLRDVSRCLKIFVWLMKQCFILNNHNSIPWISRSLNIAIGLCYYFRLNIDERQKLSKNFSTDNLFSKSLEQEVDRLCKSFLIPGGVALNQGLKENLFILFVSIITTTPIVLVGKPGTSKTLSFQIVRDNLSHNKTEFGKKLSQNNVPFAVKPIHTIAFQCTRDSKPQGIKERWDQAMRHSENNQIKPILLLDEIGLAEHSKHSPLKILHQLLEDPKISFVGISNWPLDAAKMNRVVMHQIPSMTPQELKNTGLEMIRHYRENLRVHGDELKNEWLEEEIENIAKVYDRVINTPKAFEPKNKKNFFGARDFYSLIRYQLQSPSYRVSFEGFMRNFGGIPRDDLLKNLGDIFHNVLGISKEDILKKMSKFTPMDCVQQNLLDIRTNRSKLLGDNYIVSRHCMVISESEHSWQVLLEMES
ncbi:hypothetical protein RFI_32210 [Reticulomyxa filosa]|uniref:AAA+ ATPase domain-containing protein n=1 Tax=Reticulomyxa filosa TaxID=46433 RepID=X6LU66_RETFI|nr:hypothetical protein RFI_32210 [Reticulomyxa filosa]|eukprot:ETO05189.1 hypothetical protein RFI_32210 [Reticulomyxa filosa]